MKASTDALASTTAQALELREKHWDKHPLILAKAKLPTPPNLEALALVKRAGRRHRGSVAFWAHPVTGKSSCIELLKINLPQLFKGAGVFCYEFKGGDDPRHTTEARRARREVVVKETEFLHDVLEEMELDARIEHALPARRRQLRRALMALAGRARHLFIIFDEAENVDQMQMSAFKSQINWLTRSDYRVTLVLFGQVELLDKRNTIISDYRSDLDVRYTSNIYEMRAIGKDEELEQILAACDDPQITEFPAGSKLCYTHLLFPQAYENGFRLQRLATPMMAAFRNASSTRRGESGIAMQYIAEALAEYLELTREQDGTGLVVDENKLALAVKACGYAWRKPVKVPVNTHVPEPL